MPKNNIYKNMERSERIDLELRNLFSSKGYSRFKMGKFEDYDLYARNKDFIPSEDIITVMGDGGKLIALRPDLTLSIVKYYRPEENNVERLYYSETIYRSAKDGAYQGLRQTGLECIGDITNKDVEEVTALAALSLKTISKDFILDLSHMGFLQEILARVPSGGKKEVLDAISKKNPAAIDALGEEYMLPDSDVEGFKALTSAYGNYKEVLPKLKDFALTRKSKEYLEELEEVCKMLAAKRVGGTINIDFSIVNNMTYYSGILFRGYVPGIPTGILSGGRYDGVMEHMGKKGGAIGFALYLDSLDALEGEDDYTALNDDYINIALPKGRLGNKIYAKFEKAGYSCKGIKDDNRKLVFQDNKKKIRYFWVKPTDVTVYVERGTADIGACGSDIIAEYSPDIYEVLDLQEGKCTMAIAGKKDFRDDTSKTLRVATKFPQITREYFDKESRNIDIIKLHGSIELAPVLGMSDVIVDIVETGKTLKENDLVKLEDILPVSARLIINKSSFKFKNKKVVELIEKIKNE